MIRSCIPLLAACLLVGQALASETTKVIGHFGKYPIYDMKDEDLGGDFPFNVDGQTQVSAIMLAQRLTPVQPADIGKDGITCDFLCENPQHQVIGYDPKVLAQYVEQSKMTPAQLATKARETSTAQKEKPSSSNAMDGVPPIKVVGHTGDYDIYDLTDPDRHDNQLSHIGPGETLKVYSAYYRDARDYVRFLKPVSPEDIRRRKVYCDFLCTTPSGEYVGYDSRVYAGYLSMLEGLSPEERAKREKRLDDNVRDAKASIGLHDRLLAEDQKRADDEAAQWAAYRQSALKNRPAPSNPGTHSGVPVAVIRQAITSANPGGYDLTTWTETNAYALQEHGEAVHYVEYQGAWYIKSDMVQYLGSKGGISFRSATLSTKGRIGLVKRGSGWYLVKQ